MDTLCSEKVHAGAWVEVNLDAIVENFETVKSVVGYNTKVCAVIKADAYGHGAVGVAEVLEGKVDYFAVAVLDEGIELRKHGIKTPILILGPLMEGQEPYVIRYGLTQTVCSYQEANNLSHEAKKHNAEVKVHIKVDTGMGRIGVHWEKALDEIAKIKRLPHIYVEGIFTHYATADSEDKSYVMYQWNNFQNVLQQLKDKGIEIPISHVATSATIIDLPFMSLDMVRPGLMLYGLYPRENMREKVDLKPALTFKAKFSYVKDMEKPMSISYGRRYIAQKGEKIGTLPVGYNDGYRRLLTNQGEVLVKGVRCPVVGTVCMDHIMVNVTGLNVSKDCEAVIIGKQGREEISVNEIANKLHTISYEVVTSLGNRLPRLYFQKGKIVATKTLMGYASTCVKTEKKMLITTGA